MLRDWNEEYQSCRDLPRESVHERYSSNSLLSVLPVPICAVPVVQWVHCGPGVRAVVVGWLVVGGAG